MQNKCICNRQRNLSFININLIYINFIYIKDSELITNIDYPSLYCNNLIELHENLSNYLYQLIIKNYVKHTINLIIIKYISD